MAKSELSVKLGERNLTLSNVEKVLYPGNRFTKGQVIDYYARVAPYILPHLKDRPITLKRYPEGVRDKFFYEKNAPAFTPPWVRRFAVSRHHHAGVIHYILINDLPTLVWVANTASIELHPFLHRVPKINVATEIVFDLDPGEGADIVSCARVAMLVRDLLDEMRLKSFVKVSGSKGLQLYVPLNEKLEYDATKQFAKTIAEVMQQRHADLVVAKMAKELRKGKVFIDWSQNSETKTTVCVYSLRAKADVPYVSLPVTWDELAAAERSKDAHSLFFEPDEALKRLAKTGDLFADVENLKQSLPKGILEAGAMDPPPKSLEKYRTKRDFSKSSEPSVIPERSRVDDLPWASLAGSRREVFKVGSLPQAKIRFAEPMLAKLVNEVPDSPEWQYELKLDGHRALIVKRDGKVDLFSRRGNRLNEKYPAIAAAFERLSRDTVLDGEIVALDSKGRPDFNRLQNWKRGRNLFFYAFDILAYKGRDVSKLPLRDRRRVLDEALSGLSDPIRLSPVLDFPAKQIVRAARENGLEGVVGKRRDSKYEPGQRSGAWVKYKTQKGQELVIGGYLRGNHGFDSLLVGYYDDGDLIFNAKVRNGFTPAVRQQVSKRFKGLETNKCPFANLPEPKNARRGKALTKDAMKECKWLKPKLVAQIDFMDWTEGNHLREATFAGMRDDKDPREVGKETASGST